MKTPRVVALPFMYGVEYMIFPNQKKDIRSDPAAWITAPFIDLDTQSKAGSDVADDQVEATETLVDVICVSCSLQVFYIIIGTCWDRIYCGAMTLNFDLWPWPLNSA